MLQSFTEAKNVRGKEQVNRKCYPKVNTYSEKVAFKEIFWNCRMVGKRKTSTRALRLHN